MGKWVSGVDGQDGIRMAGFQDYWLHGSASRQANLSSGEAGWRRKEEKNSNQLLVSVLGAGREAGKAASPLFAFIH